MKYCFKHSVNEIELKLNICLLLQFYFYIHSHDFFITELETKMLYKYPFFIHLFSHSRSRLKNNNLRITKPAFQAGLRVFPERIFPERIFLECTDNFFSSNIFTSNLKFLEFFQSSKLILDDNIYANSEVKQHIFNKIKYNFNLFIGQTKKMQVQADLVIFIYAIENQSPKFVICDFFIRLLRIYAIFN